MKAVYRTLVVVSLLTRAFAQAQPPTRGCNFVSTQCGNCKLVAYTVDSLPEGYNFKGRCLECGSGKLISEINQGCFSTTNNNCLTFSSYCKGNQDGSTSEATGSGTSCTAKAKAESNKNGSYTNATVVCSGAGTIRVSTLLLCLLAVLINGA